MDKKKTEAKLITSVYQLVPEYPGSDTTPPKNSPRDHSSVDLSNNIPVKQKISKSARNTLMKFLRMDCRWGTDQENQVK